MDFFDVVCVLRGLIKYNNNNRLLDGGVKTNTKENEEFLGHILLLFALFFSLYGSSILIQLCYVVKR